MCHFNRLHNNEDGYVVRCNACKHFHVGFGTTVLAFTQDQFYDFVKTIDDYYEENKMTDSPGSKVIRIPTIARSIMLLYSVTELFKLINLLHTAKDCLNKEKLFVFNEN